MTPRHWLLCTILLASASPLLAYSPEIHERITESAVTQAAAGIHFQTHLGIELSKTYGRTTPVEWAKYGSSREDDVHQSFPPFRSLNHFFDPVHEAPLTVGRWPACITNFHSVQTIRADEWALAFQPLNAWGLPKARDYQEQTVLGPNPGTRDQNAAFLFRSLGHMVHLVQDMAQPEHTRNDQHLWASASSPSLYEKWSFDNLARKSADTDPFFTGYATVVLPSFASYFHDPLGRGMADYSNRNFVTQDTNYHDQTLDKCFKYDFPSIDDASARLELITERPLDDNGVPYDQAVLESIYTSAPVDLYGRFAETDGYHALLSAFDAETKKYDASKSVYSLNDSSYLTRAAMLLPRAVGYSAGLIDHFFRGKIDATWKKLSSGPYAYELTVTNRSPVAIGADARFSAIYRATPAYFNRTNSDDTAVMFMNEPLQSLVPGFAGLAPGASMTIHVLPVFGLKSGDSVTRFERRIVIQGTMGTEQGSVISLVQNAATTTGLVAELNWDGTTFMSLAVDEYADPSWKQLTERTQACYRPDTNAGVCSHCCHRNLSVLRQEPGSVSVGAAPQPGRSYKFYVHGSSRLPQEFEVRFKLDGEVLMEGTLVLPGCTTVGFCSSIVDVFRYDAPH